MAYDPEARRKSQIAMIISIVALVLVLGGLLAFFATRGSNRPETTINTLAPDATPTPADTATPVPQETPTPTPESVQATPTRGSSRDKTRATAAPAAMKTPNVSVTIDPVAEGTPSSPVPHIVEVTPTVKHKGNSHPKAVPTPTPVGY